MTACPRVFHRKLSQVVGATFGENFQQDEKYGERINQSGKDSVHEKPGLEFLELLPEFHEGSSLAVNPFKRLSEIRSELFNEPLLENYYVPEIPDPLHIRPAGPLVSRGAWIQVACHGMPGPWPAPQFGFFSASLRLPSEVVRYS